MLKALYDWTLSWSAHPQAPYALFLVAFAESSFFPIPPDLLLIPMCLAMPEQSFFYALICTVGSVLGGVFGFGIGLYGGRPLMLKVFKHEKVVWIEKLYQKYEAWAIGIAGFSPIPYKIFTIAAGVFRVRLKILIVMSLLSRGARFFIIATLLYFYGVPIKNFIDTYFGWVTLGFVILVVGGFVAIKFMVRKE